MSKSKDFVISNGKLVEYKGNDTRVEIPSSVTNIDILAFHDCSSLTSITLPESVTSIGYQAFYDCTSLNYNIYGTIKYLGNEGNPYLVAISTTDTNLANCEIHKQTKILAGGVFQDYNSLASITLPDSVTSIGVYAFAGCSNLTSITMPNGVTSIGESAFYGCSSLTNITLPNGVTSIGHRAFYGCSSLTSITMPDSVTSIGFYAFYDCSSLTNITIPNGVTSIGESAFSCCSNLTRIYYKGTVSDWKKISIDLKNGPFRKATRFYHSEKKPTREGNYWHYVDGEPTVW